MKRFVQTKIPETAPQAASVVQNNVQYWPVFLHGTIDQTHPLGHKTTFSQHEHDFYHIVLYTKGRGEYSMEGTFRPAGPGSCVLVHPGQRHDFVSRWEHSVYSEITFAYRSAQGHPLCTSFEKLLSLCTGIEIPLPPRIVLPIDRIHAFHNILTTMVKHLTSSHRLAQYNAHHDLSKTFNFLVTNVISSQQSPLPEYRLQCVKEYIEKHYLEQICTDELAKIAGFSKGYFFREFKKQFAVSPVAYQQIIRIEAAKTLLKTTTLRCNEIAFRAGFTDPHFFHRIFKKHTKLTPGQFRKNEP